MTESHQRVIDALATVIEHKLAGIEKSLLYVSAMETKSLSVVDDFNEEEKKMLNELIADMRESLNKYCAAFGTSKGKASLRRDILIQISFLWEELAGSSGKRLEKYGHVDEELKKKFDGYVGKMSDLCERIMNTCK